MLMKKNLRYVLMSALMLVCSSALAENIIWQEDWTGYDADVNPQGINANYTFTGTVVSEKDGKLSGTKIYSANLAGGEAPELLVAKNGGSFSAKVPIDGIKGEVTLAYKTNRNDLTVEVEGATLGEKSRTGNDDMYTVTIPDGTTEITVTFKMTSSSNARLDNIKLYQGTAKKPAGISWGKASTSLTMGEEVTLTLSNANNLPITYSSSDETVATISAQGVITLVAPGKTTLTATFAGNDEYEAQTVTIEVTVKEAQGQEPPKEAITVAKAIEIASALEDKVKSADTYFVKGFVVGTPDFQRRNDQTLYGNVNLDIADVKGGETKLVVYRAKGFENKNFTEETISLLKEGDEVVFAGKLQNYSGTMELTDGYLVSVNGQDAHISQLSVEAQQGRVYTLAGQRVAQPTKGLYIIGGKKVVMK